MLRRVLLFFVYEDNLFEKKKKGKGQRREGLKGCEAQLMAFYLDAFNIFFMLWMERKDYFFLLISCSLRNKDGVKLRTRFEICSEKL